MGEIPCDFYRDNCLDADLPMAAVSVDNKFIWVNHAFERITGYSIVELHGKTWMSITKQEDVGSDLEAAEHVAKGRIASYRMEKDYVHKRGHLVPVELIVHRYPVASHVPMTMFRVQAYPARATRPELEQVQQSLLAEIAALKSQVVELCEKGSEQVRVNVGDQWRDGHKSGKDVSTNSDKAIRNLTWAVIALFGAFVWMAYYYVCAQNGVPVLPPFFWSAK